MSRERFLTLYSGVLTAVFAATILAGFASRTRQTSFDEISVRRINIVEPDGTLRMVLSGKAAAPGLIIKRKEYPRQDRQTAGIIFFDDEGTEDGGLIFGGAKNKDGKVESFGHLSFDQYQQDQVFTIDAGEEDGRRRAGVGIWDRGDYPIMEAFEASERIQKLPRSGMQKIRSIASERCAARLSRPDARPVGGSAPDGCGRPRPDPVTGEAGWLARARISGRDR